MNITREKTAKGVKSILTYWYQGIRYRPTLGYVLTPERERQEALQRIQSIHDAAHKKPDVESLTFEAFVPLYLERMVAMNRQRNSITRNTRIIEKHLVPFFGRIRLHDVRLEHGDRFIVHRRAQKAAEGTIERECSTLSAIMNYAVDAEYLDKNRLRRMAVPAGARRSRIASPEELQAIYAIAFPGLKRAITIALNTGLREQRIVDLEIGWIDQLPDGPWLFLPKARTKHKNNPDKLPLNHLAYQALQPSNIRSFGGGRIFQNWNGGNQLGQIFTRTIRKAGLVDLHFHDLRHTFSTTLENLGVDSRTIDLLTGHKIHGMGETYRHGGAGRDKQLRDAVTTLEQHWRAQYAQQVPLSLPLTGGTIFSKAN